MSSSQQLPTRWVIFHAVEAMTRMWHRISRCNIAVNLNWILFDLHSSHGQLMKFDFLSTFQ
uniref:Uncharacterized protein n=1 Tax=Romanomermis culicivorax TaxID=13658 RepID=A0A915I172_ROMCU